MKRPLLLVLSLLALACEKKSGPRPDPDPPQPSPQTPAASPVVQATVHSRDTFPVTFEGVLVPARYLTGSSGVGFYIDAGGRQLI